MANLQAAQDAGPRSSLHIPSYVSGYFDGEGCFSVAIGPRPTLEVGWEVRPSVSISQNGDRAEVIERIAEFFACGSVRPDRSDRTVKWETRRLLDLTDVVLPHFRRYPLLSGKQRDVQHLDTICSMMLSRHHLTRGGLVKIMKMAESMNPSGKRRYYIEDVERTFEVKA